MNKKHNFVLNMLIALLFLMVVTNVNAQSHYAADVNIQTITVEDFTTKYSTTVVVHSGTYNGATNVELRIILPFPVTVWAISGDGSCSVVTSSNAGVGDGYIQCQLGDMEVDSTMTVQVTTLKNSFYTFNKFSAFAVSELPDPSPENNFAYGEPR